MKRIWSLRAEVNFWGVNKLTKRLASQANDFANTSSCVLGHFVIVPLVFQYFTKWNFGILLNLGLIEP